MVDEVMNNRKQTNKTKQNKTKQKKTRLLSRSFLYLSVKLKQLSASLSRSGAFT